MQVKRHHHCPLCGGPNSCALAQTGDMAASCWCREIKFAPATLARIATELQEQACICPRCATSMNETSADTGNTPTALGDKA
ncbi:cysteine-rich CWC family protein [Chitinimonas sp. PSY-7]|uniref:cysteine-rich CWC family protein n=1 Tax=Chitinimonas sp. PSY-7 TaxID=3459088 RepID=UPI00403FED0E